MAEIKLQIHEFDTTIYPMVLYVVENTGKDTIKAEFTDVNGDELNLDGTERGSAYTILAMHKKSMGLGPLVVLQEKGEHITPSIIAHEADHAANKIFLELGMTMTFTDDEHHAYLVGWIAEMIASVVWGK